MLNIMLSFLSPIKLQKGTIKIDSKYYPELDEQDGFGNTESTNESGLRFVMNSLSENGEKLDYYVCLTSETTRNDVLRINSDGYGETHLLCFKHRVARILAKYHPNHDKVVEDFIIDVPYNEKAGIEDYLTSVLMVINEIRLLQKEDFNQKIVLHLDLTGGPRDANMLLLIITRMFAYDKNVIVKNVVYSNLLRKSNDLGEIEEIGLVQMVTDAYHLLDLVSGVAEFINFGSMASLNRYYDSLNENMKSKELNDFIDAMNDFSNKVILCRFGELKKSVVRLKESICVFENRVELLKDNEPACEEDSQDRTRFLSVIEQLMFGFLNGFKEKYELLFNCNPNDTEYDLRLIRWCYENNYLQQCMTLITERIPLYLFDKHIIDINDEERKNAVDGIKKYNEVKGNHSVNKNSLFEFAYWYMNNSVTGKLTNTSAFKKKSKVVFQEFFKNIRKKLDNDSLPEKLDKYAADYYCQEKYNRDEIIANLRQFEGLLKNVQLHETVPKDESVYLSNALRKVIPDYDELLLTNILKRLESDNTLDLFDLIGGKFDERFIKFYPGQYYEKMVRLIFGEIISEYDIDSVLDVMLLYYKIKDERNAVNHAHDKEEKITLDQLKEMIRTLINGLENLTSEGKVVKV